MNRRERLGLTVQEVSDRLHIAPERVGRLEAGITPVWQADLRAYETLLDECEK